jgi:predicted GH43/DUF377 family glycosyl hydrolase
VLLRPFLQPGDRRGPRICEHVLALSEPEVRTVWARVELQFAHRHPGFHDILKHRCDQVRRHVHIDAAISEERALLIGSYFSHEYSVEAAALFNPSIVPHPDQSDVPAGALRFVLSLRATGEGHVSSLTFRSGMLDERGAVEVEPSSPFCLGPTRVTRAPFEKDLFERKLQAHGLAGAFGGDVLDGLAGSFTLDELRTETKRVVRKRSLAGAAKVSARQTLVLARSNYEVAFPDGSRLSERVLFPVTPSQSNGIEDARFVLFEEEGGGRTYYATYTAYDGRSIQPQLLETNDFVRFRFVALHGPAVKNKGMALFPRKIRGRYVMLGRQDYENIHLMFSDHVHFWRTQRAILRPRFPWELVQLGNCGSPIETRAGWLVLSHGVGPMRRYCIGAFLLDLDDPTKVIGRLREPLLEPEEAEREGYVPNVVYSCGSLVHGGRLILPYAMSDSATTFASVSVDDLLAAMR